jgi:hypothetical protein
MKGFAVISATLSVLSCAAHADFWSDAGNALNNSAQNVQQTVTHPDQAAKNILGDIQRDPRGAIINPMQFTNPTGIPQPGDLIQTAVEHPDDLRDFAQHPENIFDAPLYSVLESARERARSEDTYTIPAGVREQLSPYFSEDLMDSVVWTSTWGVTDGLPQTLAMACGAYAITLVDVIVFRTDELAQNPVLWAHELTHVEQYQRWGTPEFSRRYTGHSSDVENEAYARENQIRVALSQPHWNNPEATGNLQASNAWQPAAACYTNIGACPNFQQQVMGGTCACADAWGRPWFGVAR